MYNRIISSAAELSHEARAHVLRTAHETRPNWYRVPEPDSGELRDEIWYLWGRPCMGDDDVPVWGISGDELEALIAKWAA